MKSRAFSTAIVSGKLLNFHWQNSGLVVRSSLATVHLLMHNTKMWRSRHHEAVVAWRALSAECP